jgi:hypothetical protein
MDEWCSWSKVVLPKSISLISGFFRMRTFFLGRSRSSPSFRLPGG